MRACGRSISTGIGAGAANESEQTLTVTATSDNPALIPNPAVSYSSPSSAATLSFTPAANASGTATITVRVSDDGGIANGGVDMVEQTFAVLVAPVNDAPVATDGSLTTNEDTPASGTLSASDVEGDSLTYSLVADGAKGSATVNADGSYTYTPNANATGADSFTVKVNAGASISARRRRPAAACRPEAWARAASM